MPEDLLLEVGTEEIPASFIGPALDDLRRIITEGAATARLTYGEVATYGTPRRLAVLVRAVSDGSPDVSREVQGPSAKAAFGTDGKPTQAAVKFAESRGVKVDQLARVSTPKGEYLSARVVERGQPAGQLLPQVLHAAVHGIKFAKSMRWGDVEQTFARPVHWIVALLGKEVLPVVFGDVRSGRVTRGHRFANPKGPNPAIEIRAPADYLPTLRASHVVADVAERRNLVRDAVQASAQKAGGQWRVDERLVEEVSNLVEEPAPILGSFEERHLDLPPEVLVQEMRTHQRYFSVVDGKGKLMPHFVAISNTPVDAARSARGYERVLRSRLADGRFFFDEDRKTPLAERVPRLERVVFQQKLGSYREKVQRIGSLSAWLAEAVGFNDVLTLERAALLCKADLVTGMVGEFPELQGVMGREYARASGEPPAVAEAIADHYLPRGAADALPQGDAGALLGIADRLDTLCGLFAIGKAPTGTADPFGLRRACLAIINVTLARRYRYSLSGSVDEALKHLASKVADVKRKAGEQAVAEQVLDFVRGRLRALWSEKHPTDVVEAVLAAGFDDLVAAQLRLEALARQVSGPEFAPLAVAFKRVVNIVEKQAQDVKAAAPNAKKLVEEPEQELHRAYSALRGKVAERVKADDYAGALKEIVTLKPAIDRFFDKVMVMAEDRELRENRIRLLIEIGGLFSQIADFSKLQTLV
ncbi:MAG TPA: glycine--tRNA ligase subunit beta [Myxococcaceae bacterium]|nr:glycine--tRNA ligase subunit beta [Myxococcaceae bacterium]